ncbi:glycoside hydrolase family 17 protein [Exserohilum turcica Et28A]|uniref:glucan 1,3-beta-glucosidase n=1 Tax=Exserohilum turcicum (strain 28A) TaxID=671987 RepID=R0K0L3_EXST2|nr:glycoside hydrolase family 17 protein [Exserohilum turcica Et28A]EOA81992.1 glycoside hydrolase family 17 protein [Exserohilum turcica Et28A]
MGFALGTKMANGQCKTQQDYEADFDAIKFQSDATMVRGYSAADCDMAKHALAAAKAKGFKVMLGIWPDVEASFKRDLAAVIAVASSYPGTLYAVTVGSETLYRRNFTGAELADKISTVKAQLPEGVKVGTADTWNRIADGTANAVLGVSDILLINAFAFWQGAARNDAPRILFDDMAQAVRRVESELKGDKDKIPEIWGGETGWPTSSDSHYEDAVGGLDNARYYYQHGYCGIVNWGYNAFYFEAFDELWKPMSVGKNGHAADETTWGAMTADRKAKFSLKC